MSAPRFEPFTADHLEAAGEVLRARHAEHRVHTPLLADGDASAALKSYWSKENRSSVVRCDNRVSGVCLASFRPIRSSDTAPGSRIPATPPRRLSFSEIYAFAAEAWVAAGPNATVLVPAHAGRWRRGIASGSVMRRSHQVVEDRTYERPTRRDAPPRKATTWNGRGDRPRDLSDPGAIAVFRSPLLNARTATNGSRWTSTRTACVPSSPNEGETGRSR
jgi:hypothetical protein